MWSMLLRHAPAIIAAADALAARARSGNANASDQSVGERVENLEVESRDAAKLIHEIALQLNALTVAQQATAHRARTALVLAISAVVLAIGACVLVLWS